MLLNTQNLIKQKKLLESSQHQKNKNAAKYNHTTATAKVSQQAASLLPTSNPSLNSFCNDTFKNSAENQKDFVLVKFFEGCNTKVSHACISTRSILKDDDILAEIERNQTCKVMFNEKILSAVVMCKGMNT